jgi:TolB-like protein/Flp pilus assembly protein TadD
MADLFISYSSKDRSHALALVEDLRARGYSVWIDKGGISGAANWSGEIVEAINACSTMLFLVSPNSVQSDSVAREVHLASEKKKHILPIVLEKALLPSALEYSLAGIQHVYYTDKDAIINSLERLYRLKGEAAPTAVITAAPKKEDGSIHIAVLPFDDLSPQHDNQWFADGMMDELIGTLRYIENVKVPGRWDVLHYRDRRVRSRDIARELSVRYLIEGAVRKAGEKIRINASLVDAEQDEQLWNGKFDGSFDNVFEFQESVSKQIADALRLSLTPKEEAKLEEQPTQNVEAYELYLRGREQQYLLTKEGYEKALELYEQAVKLDPEFLDAYIAIAAACNVYYREYSRDPKWLKRSEKNVNRAKLIKGESAATLLIIGEIESLRGNYAKAILLLTEAAEQDPKSHRTFNTLGTLYMIMGNYPMAVKSFQKALDINETTLDYFNLLIPLNALDAYDRMKDVALKAIPVFQRRLAKTPSDQSVQFQFAVVLYRAGRTEEARELANNLFETDSLAGVILYNLGCLYDELGEPQRYIDLLQKAIKKGYREIEQTRNYEFTTKEPECEKEFQKIVAELEATIAVEGTLKEESEATG